VTADSWPHPEMTSAAGDSDVPQLGEPCGLLLIPASATGEPAGMPAARMVELVRNAVARHFRRRLCGP
jgi:hypothetical protein